MKPSVVRRMGAALAQACCSGSLLRVRLLAWLVLLLALLCGGGSLLWRGAHIETSMLGLLPALRDDPALMQALLRGNRAASSKWLLILDADDAMQTDRAADVAAAAMRQSGFFAQVVTGVDARQIAAIGQYYFPARDFLLTPQYRDVLQLDVVPRAALQNGGPDALQAMLQKALYNPVSGINSRVLQNDPLLVFYHFMRELPRANGNISSENGVFVVRRDGRRYRVIVGDIARDVFDMDFHAQYKPWRATLERQLQAMPGVHWQYTGAVEYAVRGTDAARSEVQLISHLSTVGIVLVLLLVFRSMRALLLAMVPIACGVLAGLVCTHLLFGGIHLLALVFASSVIGIAIDYSLHYLADYFRLDFSGADTGWRPVHSLQRIFAGTGLGLLTSLIAYAGIGLTPFPLLQQIAVFCCAGLLASWLSLFCLAPYLRLKPVVAGRSLLRVCGWLDVCSQRLYRSRPARCVLAVLLLLLLPLVWHSRANDDVHLLQAPDTGLQTVEMRVREIVGIHQDGRFLLLEGPDSETLLQREEALRDAFRQRFGREPDGISRYVPSLARQQQNHALLQRPAVQAWRAQWQRQLGLAEPADLSGQPAGMASPLLPDAALRSATLAPLLQRYQWQATGRGVMSVLFLPVQPRDEEIATLQHYAQQHEGVHWMDTTSDISQLFGHYRERTVWMALTAYALIAALLMLRYPWRNALRVLVGPLLAVYVTLAVFAALGIALQLFHVLALLLVLGVGTDYSIFFAESGERRDAAMLAVLLSALSTLLSFGMLALSSTAAITGFGVVVCIGIVCALLFAPLARGETAGAGSELTEPSR